MNFKTWFYEADMPTLQGGVWVDLEDGIAFADWQPAKRIKGQRKAAALEINGKPAKVTEGLAYATRLAGNQASAMERNRARYADHASLPAYLMAAEAAISAAAALTEKSKKTEIAAAIRLNQAASRASNELAR